MRGRQPLHGIHHRCRGARFRTSSWHWCQVHEIARAVRLIAQARFYSKERAMSAEAHFKQLDRAQKDALLAKANDAPLEDILRNKLPGSAKTPLANSSARSLEANVDLDYRAFHSRLVPNVDPKTIAGIRRPHFAR